MPQASVSTGAPPSEETVSTISRASLSSRTTRAISASGLITPVEVSLWTSATASYFLRAGRCARLGIDRLAQGAATLSAALPTTGDRVPALGERAVGQVQRRPASTVETTALSMMRVELPVRPSRRPGAQHLRQALGDLLT